MKQCSVCKVSKALDDFYATSGRSPDGRMSRCKSCDSAQKKARYRANPEPYKAQAKQWREADPDRYKQMKSTYYAANIDEHAARNRAWRESNPDKKAAADKAWSKANADRKKATTRAWQLANPERKARTARGGHLKRKFGISLDRYEAMLASQGGGCAICGSKKPGGPRRGLTFAVDHDHITGAVRGLLCLMCNSAIGFLKDRIDLIEQAAAYVRGESISQPRIAFALQQGANAQEQK